MALVRCPDRGKVPRAFIAADRNQAATVTTVELTSKRFKVSNFAVAGSWWRPELQSASRAETSIPPLQRLVCSPSSQGIFVWIGGRFGAWWHHG